MRLLNCKTKTLEDFVGRTIPPYAILSHTWEAEEAVFDDILRGDLQYRQRKGWPKIEKSCKQALSDGWYYLWADTVCIKKSSSAELSEAINSMFKWYSNAAVCYAYLRDLPEVTLEKSRWFSRGWALQEMIAPRTMIFYDRNWVAQGSKIELLGRLERITGVDAKALRGRNLRLFSVARKMSWGAGRTTTRIEDIAYCLMGIFDISMPLLYGEGTRAFTRLQEEIIKEYDDGSLFAWISDDVTLTPGFNLSGVLAPSPDAFSRSANFVACLTPNDELGMSSPISVTSRGVRKEVPVEPFGEDSNAFLVRLNCKRVAYDRTPGKRIGIIVAPLAKIQGYKTSASIFGRTQTYRLYEFTPNTKRN